MAYYRQPEFFRDFHCMGGSCPNSCCAAWSINWTEKEIEKVKSANCSPELRKLIDTSFVPDEKIGLFKMKLVSGRNYDCPFLDENRLCSIQKELGEDYLSETCREYPRSYIICRDLVFRTCSASCPGVMNVLRQDKKAMQLINVSLDVNGVKHGFEFVSKEEKYPVVKYYPELVDFFFNIIGSTKRSLETSLVLGALAAQKLTEYVDQGKTDSIPEVIKALKPQLNRETVPAFENAKSNPEINPGFLAELTDQFVSSDALDLLIDNGVLKLDRYAEGRRIADEYLEDKPHIVRNIALDIFLEAKIPFGDLDSSIFLNYAYYVAAVSSIKLVMIALCYKNKKFNNGIFSVVSYFVRGISHNKKQFENTIKSLVDRGCKSPAFLALLLK